MSVCYRKAYSDDNDDSSLWRFDESHHQTLLKVLKEDSPSPPDRGSCEHVLVTNS
jgi:hypothetical protein